MTAAGNEPTTRARLREIVRQGLPVLVVPLCLIASVLSAAPWLRSFPLSVAGAPFYGAAVLSIVIPLIVYRARPTWLWLCFVIDAVAFVLYTLLVVLREPLGFVDLTEGLWRGPSQLLTFALPLVSPRTLMVAPVALIWLIGSVAGECLARSWYSLLPYFGFLVSFGLAYAGTQRAAGSDITRETLLAAGLLAALLLMRVAQTWVHQDETAESTQADGVLPLRSLAVGTVTTVVVALAASFAVQTSAFPKRSADPQRIPSINRSEPLAPIPFVAGLRPRTADGLKQLLFTVTTDRASSGYFPIANVDFYNGSGWSFDRSFRPSGGVLPADTDQSLHTGTSITQQYRIANGPLTKAPWMPFLYRAERVSGMSVNIDPASGMIVPAGALRGGTTYTVHSLATSRTFDAVKAARATADTATPTIDTQLPGSIRNTLDRLVKTFADVTNVPSSPALPFLQALQRTLRFRYALSPAAAGVAVATASATSTSPSGTGSSSSTPTPTPTSTPKSTAKSTPKSTPRSRPTSRSKSRPRGGSSTHRGAAAAVRPLAAKPTRSATRTKRPVARKSTPARTTPAATKPVTSAAPSSSPQSTSPAEDLAGGTGFADVLGSILGPNRTGTPEQFATLIALVARDLGVPARVVTGFRVLPDSGTRLSAGEHRVTTADAWTWVEVPIVGAGWVVLDAAPLRFTPDTKQTQSAGSPPPPTTAPPTKNALITPGAGGNAVAPSATVPQTGSGSSHGLLIALLVALAVLILLVALLLATRKQVRAARRRRVSDPRTSLIGAWRENLDVLAEAGLPELGALTSAEIAELAADQFGARSGAETAELGSAANAAAYSIATPVAAADADAAWARQRVVRGDVRRQLGVRGRLAAGLRYHRSRAAARPVSPTSWAAAERARALSGARRRRYRGRRRAH